MSERDKQSRLIRRKERREESENNKKYEKNLADEMNCVYTKQNYIRNKKQK